MACSVRNSTSQYQELQRGYEAIASQPLNPTAFWSQVSSLTEQTVQHISKVFASQISELSSSDVAIVCTGSDSRLEKCGLGSPVECIVLLPPDDHGQYEELIQKIRSVCQNYGPLLYSQIDIKRLGKDTVSTYEREEIETRVIPTRAFDATLLIGSCATFAAYKHQVFEELAKKRVSLELFKKKFVREALQNLRSELSGSPRKNPLLTVSSGTVYYEKAKRRGLKHDALRAVQYTSAYILFKAIQENKILEQEVARIPRTVLDRILWLKEKKLIQLSVEECEEVHSVYTQISYWYLQLNAQVVSAGDPPEAVAQMNIPPTLLKPILQSLYDLSVKIFKLA